MADKKTEPYVAPCGCTYLKVTQVVDVPWMPGKTMKMMDLEPVARCETHCRGED